MPVKPVPGGSRTATRYLTVAGASAAIAFYKQAFGATERNPGRRARDVGGGAAGP